MTERGSVPHWCGTPLLGLVRHALRIRSLFRVGANLTGLVLSLATEGLDKFFRYEAEHCDLLP